MTLRVVVYAEGSADRAGELSLLPASGDPLLPEHLGAVHLLIQRALEAYGLPKGALRFEAPLQVRGRDARGSDLHHRIGLRRLLSWARPELRPERVFVVVDSDDEPSRAQRLEQETADIGVRRIVVAAVREFEAWLIADTRALRKTLELDISMTKSPESMGCGEAKEQLAQWIAERLRRRVENESARSLRRALAATCDLEEVARRCPSFAEFRRKVGSH